MQEKVERRSNADRSAAMRERLLAAARGLFVARGFADTSTPAVVAAAGVTRGALYHHFADKAALFAAVLEREAEAVAEEIEGVDRPDASPLDRLLDGAGAYLTAMRAEGRAGLLLVQGPAVLGPEAMRSIEARHGEAALRKGLEDAVASGAMPALPLDALVPLLGALFDRAAIEAARGADGGDLLGCVRAVIMGLSTAPPARS